MTGVRGSLVSEYFAERLMAEQFGGRLGEGTRASGRSQVDRIRRACSSLGPASPVRAVFDVGGAPLAAALGFRAVHVVPATRSAHVRLHETLPDRLSALFEHAAARIAVIVAPWGEGLDSTWSDGVRLAMTLGARWCLLFNARQLRLVDSWRSYSRDHLEFDLDDLCENDIAFALFWAVLRAEAFIAGGPQGSRRESGAAGAATTCLLEEIIALSAQQAVHVCRSLRHGVLQGLQALMQGFADGSTRRYPAEVLFEQSLTIVYRILFLLFAEARRLLPTWHEIYRSAYSMETLGTSAEQGDGARGTWETLQAISRLVHRGCHAGTLVVTPFNGRLFSPARTPLGESGRLDDNVARRAIVALSTEPGKAGIGRQRIAYRDLGVEQLGSVYESVLDYQPVVEQEQVRKSVQRVQTRRPQPADRGPGGRTRFVVSLQPGSGRRKATGTFYTPLSLTHYLVRRSLHPLIAHARAEDILKLRVVDPAMGSGAFLVAACRYLAGAYEHALVAEGECHASDIDEADRALFRRMFAQRSLFGVDVNPMAVQLARLSLWLATLASDRPLTFLDHHLAVGDSLVGASIADVARHPLCRVPRPAAGAGHPGLFDNDLLCRDLGMVLPQRLRVAVEPGDTVEAVRDKERTLDELGRRGAPLAPWKDAADFWCACWFRDGRAAPGRGVYRDAIDAILNRRSSLSARSLAPLLDDARRVAASRRFLHWPLEFPEVFYDERGQPLDNPGFDAVVGNPPWDMLRSDDAQSRDDKTYDRALTSFARAAGIYTIRSEGHPNRFQLFVERAFQLARPEGGRVGLVAPWGLFSDHGCAGLRRLMFTGAQTDSIVSFDNAKAIFPIHRSLRFALVTSTRGTGLKPRATTGPSASRATTSGSWRNGRKGRTFCRFGEKDAAALDLLPDSVDDEIDEAAYPILLSPALLGRLSGEDLTVPDVRSRIDLDILDGVTSAFPRLSDDRGWHAEFSRELNASDDRPHFSEQGDGLPVVEGKHLEPFVANLSAARFRIDAAVADRLLAGARSFRRARLAYRDVASATNRVTLIAAMLPPDCVTTHTVFCLKTPLGEDAQWFLCGVMNSYVANYLVRLRVTSHVSAGILALLPVPRLPVDSGIGLAICRLSRQVAAGAHASVEARLQSLVARAYALTAGEFSHVLGTFPLVEQKRREAALAAFPSLDADLLPAPN